MFDKITDPRDIITVAGDIPLRHRYTPGIAGTAFFEALVERGELLASTCPSCATTYCPPRLFCERDFAELKPDTKVGPGGTLESFTVGFTGVEGEPLEEPVMLGLVRLDGADTVMMHFLLNADELEIGARVEAVIVPKARRTGSILDIQGFKPSTT